MKRNVLLNEGIGLILAGGLLLFGTDWLLPERLALPGVTFVSGLVGYILFTRIAIWKINNKPFKDLVMFGITILTSLFAAACLLIACNASSKLPLCAENKRNSLIFFNFFFPMLLVFFGWLSNYWPQSRRGRG